MSVAQLSSIENGVWMCYRHGKLIDTDECTYTPEQLRAWRHLAERCATLRHALGRDPTPKELASEHLATTNLRLTTPMFISEIAETLELSMFEIIWGKHNALTARDLIIEIARNALTHGRASLRLRSGRTALSWWTTASPFPSWIFKVPRPLEVAPWRYPK